MNETCLWIAVAFFVLAAVQNIRQKLHEMAFYFLGIAFVVLAFLVQKEIIVK